MATRRTAAASTPFIGVDALEHADDKRRNLPTAEYEAVLLRPEHLLTSGQSADAMNRALDELAERVVRLHCWFQPRFGS